MEPAARDRIRADSYYHAARGLRALLQGAAVRPGRARDGAEVREHDHAAPVDSGNDKIEAERDDYFDAGVRHRVFDGVNVGIDGYYKIGHDQLDLAQLASSVVTAPLNYRESRGWGSDYSLTYERNGLSAYLNFSYAVLQAEHISAGAFLADDADGN